MLHWPFLILLSTPGFLQETSIQEYCFGSSMRSSQVVENLKFILVPSDQLKRSDQCFTLISSPHRRELLQNYIRKLEPAVQISFSSAEIKRDPCKLKVERMKVSNQVENEGEANIQGKNVFLTASSQQSSGTSQETMTLQTLKDFEFQVQKSSIKGTCRPITPNRYEITLEVRQNPVKKFPDLPPGTVINMANYPIPEAQETSVLATSLQLTTGQKIELGKIVKDLHDKSFKTNLPNDAVGSEKISDTSEQVFLSID